MKVLEFPKIKDVLTFEEACALIERRDDVKSGIIITFIEGDEGNVILNFGDINRRDALWLSKKLEEHALWAAYDLEDEEDGEVSG